MHIKSLALLTFWIALVCGACGTQTPAAPNASRAHTSQVTPPAADNVDRMRDLLHFAQRVVSFVPGDGAGFGGDAFPDVVLGVPQGNGPLAGSLDVLSLGAGGVITLGFGDDTHDIGDMHTVRITDGPGADFIVFENPFHVTGDNTTYFRDPGRVSVSADGITFVDFPCVVSLWPDDLQRCAGVHPVAAFDARAVQPLDPAITGGDAFDLAELGLSEARFVRITDVAGFGAAPTTGFDLDAVGVVQHGWQGE